MKFQYKETANIAHTQVQAYLQTLLPALETMRTALGQGYMRPEGFINLVFDEELLMHINNVVQQKKSLKPALLLVIGIGGSNLGTQAVMYGVRGVLPNQASLAVYYADTVDPDYNIQLLHIIESTLQRGERIIINIITKSGTTTETIANAHIFLDVLMQYHPHDYHHYVVITTDEHSPLAQVARVQHYTLLTIPLGVGGRFSVFSAVGLFPLGLMGIDIQALCAGARDITAECLFTTSENNAAVRACLQYYYYQHDIRIHDLFLFSVQLETLGKWYRQLMGESLGKTARDSAAVGITPTVSIGTTDLHSVGQLYLGGPRDRFTTFVTIQNYADNLIIPPNEQFAACNDAVQNVSCATLMHAVSRGVQHAYKQADRPFCSLYISNLSAYTIGKVLQFFMIEMVYLGYLLQVNPFDQPHVELYKKETRKILEHE